MPYAMSAGEIIRKARLEAGVSQASLARRAGTSQAAISRIERGIEEPTLARLAQILTGLGWRARIELEPVAEHEAEERRLIQEAHRTPQERFDDGLVFDDFLRELDRGARVKLRRDA